MERYDVAIIGAGAVGCAIAKILSEYELKICVIEKEPDVGFETSGRNSGVVHAGFNNPEGSLKARLCVEGSRGFEKLAEELEIKYIKTGKLVTGFSDKDRIRLEELKNRGEINGVSGLKIINREEILEINPKVQGIYALFSKNTAIFNPFEYTIALAETAKTNGTEFLLNSKVCKINKKINSNEDYFEILCCKLETEFKVESKLIINCGGLYSGDICNMLGIDRYEIRPCRGEYHIIEKNMSGIINLPVYPVPDDEKDVLGVHLTPTIGGNIIVGPSAEFLEEKDDYSNDEEVMNLLSLGAEELMPELKNMQIIRSFSGIRPKLIDKKSEINGDFVIEEAESCKGFIYLVGIESPGITASVPIAKYVKEIAEKTLECEFKRKAVIKKRMEYFGAEDEVYLNQKMICRCERVTEGEILKAYDNILKLGAEPTIKGIKNRTRAFMGSCQGGFCTVDTIDVLRNKRNVDVNAFTYSGKGSEMFAGILKRGSEPDAK